MLLAESSVDGAREAFDRARTLMDLLPAGIMLVEGDSPSNARVERWNTACARLLGASPATRTSEGKLPYAYYRPDRSEPLPRASWPSIRAIATGETVHEPELHLRRPDGEWRVLCASASPLRQDGRVQGAVVVVQDVTAEHHSGSGLRQRHEEGDARSTEEALRESEARYARLAATVPGILYEFERHPDGTGRFTYLSARRSEIFGVEGQDFLEDMDRLIHPDDRRALREASISAGRSRTPLDMEVRITTPSGRARWVQFMSLPSSAPSEEVERRSGLIVDVTERKRMEEALRESEEWLKLTVEATRAGTMRGVFPAPAAELSPRARRILGIPDDFVVDFDGFMQLVHPDDRERVGLAYARTLDPDVADGSSDVEFRIVRPDGSTRWVAGRAKAEFAEVDGLCPAVRIAAVMLDITERKRAEEALRESEEWLKLTIEASGAGIFHCVPYGPLSWSTRCREMFGVPEDYVINGPEDHLRLVHPDDREAVRTATERALDPAGDGLIDVQYRCVWPDGSVRWIAGRVKIEFAEVQGVKRAVRLAGANLDVTARKREEEALRESEARSRAILASLAEGVVLHDAEGRVTTANEAAEKLIGASREVMLGHTVFEGPPPGSMLRPDGSPLPPEEHPVTLALRTGERQSDVELGMRRPDGTLVWLSIHAQPVRLPDGKVAGAVVSLFDVTQRRHALQRSEGQLRTIADSVPDAIIRFDRELRILFANKEVAAAIGVPVDGLVGKTRKELGRASGHAALFDRHLLEVFRTGSPGRFESILDGPEGRQCESRMLPERGRDGEVESVVSITRDITERKRAEEQLLASREQLRALVARLNSVREEEKARLSQELHDEMGQLLTALRMELEALEDGLGDLGMPGAVRDLLERAVAASELVARAIDSMRSLLATLRPVALDRLGLGAALRQECRRFQEWAGVTCEFVAAEGLSTFDPEVDTALFRIAQEALTNVARHARASRVAVTMERRDGAAVLRVADDGRGIRPDQSAGLGLLGMRERAERLGGELVLQASPGGGAVVEARIPSGGSRTGRGAP